MKYLAFCKASEIARASPVIGLYRDSAGDVNLPPASVSLHPSTQHLGLIS